MILNPNLAVGKSLRVKEKNNPEKKSKKEKLNQSLDVKCEKNEDGLRKHLQLKLGGFFLHEILQVPHHRQF